MVLLHNCNKHGTFLPAIYSNQLSIHHGQWEFYYDRNSCLLLGGDTAIILLFEFGGARGISSLDV